MTHTKDEALDLALEALTRWAPPFYAGKDARMAEQAITAIKQALKQPVQEPVAWCTKSDLENMAKGFSQDVPARSMRVPQLYPEGNTVLLYTTPQEAQPAPVQEPVALHAMAKRRIFDAIRGAYDLGYNDARGARAVHGDSALGYKGRDVEADHGGALFSALERYTTPSAQPAPVQEPDAYLHDDGYWTAAKTYAGRQLNDRLLFAGAEKIGVYTTPLAQPAPVQRCTSCDGTGDVHDQTGEWRGTCHCEAGQAIKAKPPAAQPAPASWMEMVTANLVREGVNKHKARELAEHFYGLAQRPFVGLTDEDKLKIEIMGGKSGVMLAEMVANKLKGRNT